MKLCACGCGEAVTRPKNTWLRGHWARTAEARVMYDDMTWRQRVADARRASGNDALRGRTRPADVVARAAAARSAVGNEKLRGRRIGPHSPDRRAKISASLSERARELGPVRRTVPRDGDRKQARWRVAVLITHGLLPHPQDVPCVDCGFEWRDGMPRHEYDHHHGYDAEHHECVEPVCQPCHLIREATRLRAVQRQHLAMAVVR